jgi:site-specific DNA recombinase
VSQRPRVALYCRVSTEEQRERQSIATQREFGERYCQLHELPVTEFYIDDGVSGTVPLENRPGGKRILDDARRRKFNQLLVFRLDRLGRETRLILNVVAELEKYDIRVRSMTEEFDTATSTGRLMLTMLSGFAAHERDAIRERSIAGTNRVAETGAWLGGIVPYGYRKVGEKAAARLIISDAPVAGLEISEADVIRSIYRMAAVEKKSCYVIADYLNALRVPCAYVRDGREILRGKRKQRTSGVWTPGRIRNLIVSATYKGKHEYGKRAKNAGRQLITRDVPAIVDEATWEKAQSVLKSNILFSKRSAKNQYLLRGLIKCGLCGLTYVGLSGTRPNGKRNFYYRCNGAHSKALFSSKGRCQSKAISGDYVEDQVWSDVECFLRNPAPVLEQLQTRLAADANRSEHAVEKLARLEGLLAQKADERNRVVGLYRRGRLSDTELDSQLDEIRKEELALEAQIAELRHKLAGTKSIESTIKSAEALLEKLRVRLDETVSWEQKRRLIEVLVAGVRVDTFEECGVKQTNITVSYRFSHPDQAMPLVLPQSYSTGCVVRIPTEPKTIGDHIRRRRLALKMLQKEVAERIGVDQCSIFNWEANASNPGVQYTPAIISFLGYNPLPQATNLGGQLVRKRTTLGLTQKEAAERLGVDPSTLAKWERGNREPRGVFLTRVKQFLKSESERKSEVA